MEIRCVCPMCGDTKVIDVDREKFMSVKEGSVHIQDAFPEMSADDRERLLTGICPTCWNAMWEEEEAEEQAWWEASMEACNG